MPRRAKLKAFILRTSDVGSVEKVVARNEYKPSLLRLLNFYYILCSGNTATRVT
jgi:hypothetical protein